MPPFLGVIIGINVDIFSAEVAAIAKILELSGVQVHGDGMLLFGNNSGNLFCVKVCRLPVSKDENVPDFAGKFGWVEFDTR